MAQAQPLPQAPMRTRDPVCGKILDQRTAKHRAEYQGKAFYFCSSKHRKLFEADPMMYLRMGVPLP